LNFSREKGSRNEYEFFISYEDLLGYRYRQKFIIFCIDGLEYTNMKVYSLPPEHISAVKPNINY